MQPLRIDVSSVLEDLGASTDVAVDYPLDRLVVGDEVFRLLEPVSVNVTLTNTGAGIVAGGTALARTAATCSRCLEPFELEIEGDVEGFYVQRGREGEIPEDQEVEPILPDNTVDLGPALVAALTIEAPFAPLHDESCAGLCPICGCDLNVERCECHAAAPETHPFAALKELLGRDADER